MRVPSLLVPRVLGNDMNVPPPEFNRKNRSVFPADFSDACCESSTTSAIDCWMGRHLDGDHAGGRVPPTADRPCIDL
jgi:hypothetical protein